MVFLRRPPTRLELKSEDMKEYEEILAERKAAKANDTEKPAEGPTASTKTTERQDRIGFKPPAKK